MACNCNIEAYNEHKLYCILNSIWKLCCFTFKTNSSSLWVNETSNCILSKNDTIRDAILSCARKPTWVSLIYHTEPTTKKCKNRKTKSRKQICSEITVNSPGNPRGKYLSRIKEGRQWEGFAEKEGFGRVLHCVSKKQDTKLLPVTSPNVNRFSKFFHWQTH